MNVKVVDLKSSNAMSEFVDSLKNTGFAVIKNHGIPLSLIRKTQNSWRDFFYMPDDYKDRFVDANDRNMGYKGFKSETAVGAKTADLKSFYHYKPGYKTPLLTESETYSMFYLLNDLAAKLLSGIDAAENTSFKDQCLNSDKTILRILHYPAMDFSKTTDAVRAAAHEDINFITLLVAASAPGLQVLNKEGEWLDVPFEENSIIVNTGDMLQLATGGKYKSTTHRVVNPENSSEDRISIPLFLHPRSDVVLADGITAGQFLEERIKQIYGEK